MRYLTVFTVIGLVASLQAATALAEDIVTGDVRITTEMFDQEIELLSPKNQIKYLDSLSNSGILINDMYSREKILKEALKRNVDKDPAVLRKIERTRQAVLVEALAADIKKNIEYPEFEPLARERYNLNKDKFVSKEEVRASHILLRSGNESVEQRKKADDLLAKLKAGADFAELAMEFSDDKGSAKNGGDLGWFTRGKMVKPFEDAVFSLKSPGDISEVVVTSYGFHIISLTERRSAAPQTFDQIKSLMVLQMIEAYQKEEVGRQLKEIADYSGADANIEVLDRAYQAARQKYLKSN